MRYFKVVLAWLALAFATSSGAAGFPSKPIQIIVPFAPGGQADSVNRLLAAELARILKVPVVVDNRSGAGTVTATTYVANAPADGYTVLVVTNSFVLPATFDKLPYDTLRDFRAVGMVITQPNVLLATSSFPANDVQGLVSFARQQKEPLLFASTSVGGPLYLSGELFSRAAGFRIQQIGYQGSAPAQLDVVAGRVPLMFDGWYQARGQVSGGKLKVLASFGDHRMRELPDVPTLSESYPGLASLSFQGLAVRSGVPDDVVATLASAVETVVKSKWFEEKTVGLLGDPQWMGPAEFGAFLASETKKWSEAAKAAQVKVN